MSIGPNAELIKCALMWLQRDYIANQWPNYDPTSDRDEDLPIDLDHVVPSGTFNFDWRFRSICLHEEVISDNFHWERRHVGNSIGNFRWLAASDNRKRGKGAYEPLPDKGDLVSNPAEWRAFTLNEPKDQPWSKKEISTFQRLIDLRTLELYENLLAESGIGEIVPM